MDFVVKFMDGTPAPEAYQAQVSNLISDLSDFSEEDEIAMEDER